MNWFNFFDNNTPQLKYPFGRGINASLSQKEEELFENSYRAFENKEILKGYSYFFESLENFSNGESNHNISYSLEGDQLNFTIFQGTAKVTGYITQEKLYAEAIITKLSSANVAVKRYILNRNYQFTYAYYFTDGEYLKLKLFHDNITMTPQKIFYPLREIALNADFDKEYIKSEFSNVTLEELSHLEKLDEEELQIKYKFMKDSLTHILEKIQTLPSNDTYGMETFILLESLFKIDYLLVPKFNIYQKISKKIQEYFLSENTAIETKNNELKEYVQELIDMDYEDFSKNFYNAKYTFNPTEKTPKEDIDNFISESILKIRWYKHNRYKLIIPTVYRYMSFYIMYNYGLNPVLRGLFHILIEVQNQSFFNSLGYTELYNSETNSFNKKTIIKRINEIIKAHEELFISLESFGEELNFNSLNEFSNSFLIHIQNLDFEEVSK